MKKDIYTQCPLYIGLTATKIIQKERKTSTSKRIEEGSTPGMCLKEDCELWGGDSCLIRQALVKFTESMGIFALGVRMYIDSMEKH